MSTLRYSGEIRIRVTYREDTASSPRFGNGTYRCFLRGPGGMTTTVIVNAPQYLTRAVDSPEAFDDAARAALSFTADDAHDHGRSMTEYAAHVIDRSGWHVGRSEAHAWPPGEAPSAPIDTVF
jgi:hypothetical protein